jgi:hypothetical protein
MIALLLMAATQGAVAQSNPVTVKQGVEEADKWTANPNPAASGQTVTVTYNGTLKVKSLDVTPVVPTDLSLVDCAGNANANGRTTANCYMVHTAGDYRLPLVYGNAIKNGTVNSAAYTGPSSGTNITKTFPNHAGKAINAPWITKSTSGSGVDKGMGIRVASAQLLWQDAKGLITKVGISGDYLTLTVGKDATEQEGNAVVAVKAGSTIVWSWHIWVTRQTFAAADLTTVATGSHDYQLTPVNVGWVGTPFGRGYSPYYQWGRKDAFIPADITVVDKEKPAATTKTTSTEPSSGSNPGVHIVVKVDTEQFEEYQVTLSNSHTVYDINGNPVTGIVLDKETTSANIAANIKAPTTFRYKADNIFSNLWNAKTGSSENVSSKTVKTVYDPCPPGFCVPTDNLYSYLGSLTVVKLPWDDERMGRIYTLTTETNGETITTPTVFFPAQGKRDYREQMVDVDRISSFWSATGFVDSNSNKKAHVFYISDRGLAVSSYQSRGVGSPVRAVAEE